MMTAGQRAAWTRYNASGEVVWRDHVFLGYEEVKGEATKMFAAPGGGADQMRESWYANAIEDLDLREKNQARRDADQARVKAMKADWDGLDSSEKFDLWMQKDHVALMHWPHDKQAQKEFGSMMHSGPLMAGAYALKEGAIQAGTGGLGAIRHVGKVAPFVARVNRYKMGTTYVLKEGKNVIYVGRTINPAARRAAHEAAFLKEGRVVKFVEDKAGMNYAQMRGREQDLYDLHSKVGPLENKIRPIGEGNPKMDAYLKASGQMK